MKHIGSTHATLGQEEITLRLLKKRLAGSNLKKLRISKNLSKYGIAKDCGVTWRTVYNWEKGIVEPSDENALILARYLGLIEPSKVEVLELKKEQAKLKKKIDRLI